jgi:hypothetical protein
MARAYRRSRPSAYGATIDSIQRVLKSTDKVDYRVWWHTESGSGNALMHPSANPTAVRVGEVADVIRNGNGRIVMLRRPEEMDP